MMSMRKLLLGTTALVGASVLGVATPDVARAAEVLPGGALDVTISGFARFLATGGDLDNQRNNPNVTTGLDFRNDTEVHVILRGKHDATGMEYGGTVEFEADTNRTDNTDETWLFIRGGFGEVRFGDEDGAVDNSAIGAYTIAAATGGIDGTVVDVLAISPVRPTNSDDATKIRYYTPSFGGFSVGVSYTPNADIGVDPTNSFAQVSGDSLAPKDVELGDWFEGALVYEGDFGGLGLQASLVGSIADIKDEAALGGDDGWAWYGGLATDIFGVKVAGGFGDEEFGALEKTYYNVGAGYGIGLVNVSINYGQIIDSDGYGADEPYNIVGGADFALMPGLVLGGEVAYFNNDIDDGALLTGDDDGYVYLGTLRLAF
jgi:outer membrane protein OmpU